ncbi:MAG: T9SS type A sorting domain-containing protein [Gemmatimonadales bacterium]
MKKRGFRLFAQAGEVFQVNQVTCGILSDGQICVSITGSSTIPGSAWPKGTNNQYTFNSGISMAGVIGPELPAWAGDTTGAFFFDGGGQSNAEEVFPIYNASDPVDFNAWPDFARVPDGNDPGAAVFDPLLQGTVSASQGDVWFMTWDGNPAKNSGRPHPLGVAVETRGLAWNFPTGNQDILYFIYTIYNISSVREADYALVRPALRTELLKKATEFQAKNEAAFGIDIPDGGYSIQSAFIDFAADQDVTVDAAADYSTFNNLFNMAITYHAKLAPQPGNVFDPAIHAPPFLAAPGFVGTKYLRSPILPDGTEAGTVLAGETTNRGSFPDPINIAQLYRMISANLNPAAGDPQCNTGDVKVTHICFVNDQPADTRTLQSSGPLVLAPGGQVTIVMGYVFAAPVSTGKCSSVPCPVTMAPDPLRFLGATPSNPGVDAIDSAMGYRGFAPGTPDVGIVQDSVVTVPSSLLAKAKVAQQIFDSKFLLPFAPAAPDFFVVPGDGQVSVLWRPSPSETAGDAFFVIANDPASGTLYDPSYRQFDVEGYRVYRGRTDSPNALELVAQFDYAGTQIYDFRGFINPKLDCAPELGPAVGGPASIVAGCPATEGPNGGFTAAAPGGRFVDSLGIELNGPLVQIKGGGRTALAVGTAVITAADTAITGGKSGLPALANTGVPFAFTDNGSGLVQAPRNNVRYFYSVTTFDINSFASGPSSLESQRITKTVTPVRSASNVAAATLTSGIFGSDGTELNPVPATPFTIDPETGTFNGPPPPTAVSVLSGVFAPLIPALLPALSLSATIDSVIPRSVECGAKANFRGYCAEFFVTFQRDATVQRFQTITAWPFWANAAATGETSKTAVEALGSFPVAPDEASAARFGIPPGAASFNAAVGATLSENIRFSAQENQQARRLLAGISPGGSRWFDGANETLADPAYSIRVGHVAGVDSIWTPLSHTDQDPVTPDVQAPVGENACMQLPPHYFATMGRQADIELTWGDNGAVASVKDVTNKVDVPFHQAPQASWGFVVDGNGNGKIDWVDFIHTPGTEQAVHTFDGNAFCAGLETIPPVAGNPLVQTATVTPVSFTADVGGAEAPGNFATSGQGFGLYINGQQFIFGLTGGVLPAAGTKWTLRMYSGVVTATTGASTTDPSGYTYTPALSSPAIPGLQIKFNVAGATSVLATQPGDLRNVHTVPDPYYVTNSLETTSTDKIIKFVNLPAQAIIRIYSSSGVLVSLLEHNSTTLGGDETWNVRNRNNQVVASGVYFYHIEAGSARRVGRFTVVNFAQ